MITYGIDARPKSPRQLDVPSASDTTLYTASTGIDGIVERIHVCNKTAGAVTFDAWIDGTTDCYLFKGKSVAANDYFAEKDMGFRLVDGDVLKVKSSAATSLDIYCTILEIHKNTPR